MEKNLARKAALAARGSLAKSAAAEKSAAIVEQFLNEFDGESYLLYHSVQNEVQTHQLIDNLYGMNKTIYLPVVSGNELELGLYRGDNSLSCGAFGIKEPDECISAEYIDIAVIPGVAFDKELYRVGHGKGYYDRLLGTARIGVVVGFAFECQLVDSFIHEPHDMPVDVLVTENHIYRRNS